MLSSDKANIDDFYPHLSDVRALKKRLMGLLVETPVIRSAPLEELLGGGTRVVMKLEFLQQTGTFKARGALSVVTSLDESQRAAGITAVSAGNHAIAAAFAARSVGASAKVVMLGSANPMRVQLCKDYGAEVVIAGDAHDAFALAEKIQKEEGRFFVHPFEGPKTFLGTASLGLEICEQISDLDVVIVAIGGGGLCAGVSSAIKQLRPEVTVIGVEPEGADTMRRSFESGKPEAIEKLATIADSLGAPYALPMSMTLCKKHVDELVTVTDDQLRNAMGYLFSSMKMALEPACAATTAALIGPLSGKLRGQSVGLVMCGSNIDWTSFSRLATFA